MSENIPDLQSVVGLPLRMIPAPRPEQYFLRKRGHFNLTVAVIATTLFSWFNINSYLIILLLLCRLLDGDPRRALKTAFTNTTFLAYAAIFLIEFAGLFYTHHLFAAWKHMESKATLIAIPFIFCAGPFADNNGYRRLLTGYCLLLAAICLYCLGMAVVEYHWQGTTDVFFYHQLTAAIGVNAVFFSGYVFVALLFLLFSALSPVSVFSSRRPRAAVIQALRISLLLFFTGMMVLLSSRLLLLLLMVVFVVYFAGRRRPKMNGTTTVSLFLLFFLAVGVLAFTNNPVSRRCKELSPGAVVRSIRPIQHIHPKNINGISLRLFLWRSGRDILDENHAWLFGVSSGDSQDLLNQKYMQAGMSQGYLGYNFHNEYLEILVRSGLFGAAIFILAVCVLVARARSTATVDAGFTIAMVLLLSLTESSLEMQHSLFLCCFFPLLSGYRKPTCPRPLAG